jgi:hypothetical protein
MICIASVISLGACDNSNRGIQDNEEADNNQMDQRDTSEISEEFNERGVPTEGLPDNNSVREDTLNVGDGTNAQMGELPSSIRDNINADANLRNKRITNTRKYTQGGTTYYELTFDNEQNKVIYDEKGNRSNNQ